MMIEIPPGTYPCDIMTVEPHAGRLVPHLCLNVITGFGTVPVFISPCRDWESLPGQRCYLKVTHRDDLIFKTLIPIAR